MMEKYSKGMMMMYIFCQLSWYSFVWSSPYVVNNVAAIFEGMSQTGDYKKFVWSLNLPHLQVITTGRLEDPTISDVLKIVMESENKELLSCQIQYEKGFKHDCDNSSSIKVSVSSSSVSNFIITLNLPQLNVTFNETELKFFELDVTIFNQTIVTLRECDHAQIPSGIQTISITPLNETSDYDSYGNCSCSDPGQSLYNYTGKKHDGIARCNGIADWTGCNDAQCWYAPTNVTVNQNNTYAGKVAGFTCSYDEGFPLSISKEYYINQSKVEENYILKSDHYNNSYYCKVITNYTNVKTDEGISASKILKIYFGPEICDMTTTRVIPIGNSGEVYVYLKANDKNKSLTAELTMNGVSFNGSRTVDDIYYNYSYLITVNSSDDYGTYVFIAKTVEPEESVQKFIEIKEYASTTSSKVGFGTANFSETVHTIDSSSTENNLTPDIKPETIIIICACIVGVIIILIVVVLLLRRYWRTSLQVKEERLNPIYDTSAVDNADKEDRLNPLYGSRNNAFLSSASTVTDTAVRKDNEKEEKINPVYGTASAEADNSAKLERVNPLYASSGEIILDSKEVYAEVQKKDKKGKSEKDSPGFSAADSNDTYTEVKKVKKGKTAAKEEVMYAEVHKGNDKDKALTGSRTGLHGTQE